MKYIKETNSLGLSSLDNKSGFQLQLFPSFAGTAFYDINGFIFDKLFEYNFCLK